MSDAEKRTDADDGGGPERRSVLSELPRRRPQRPSSRREATRARRADGAAAGTQVASSPKSKRATDDLGAADGAGSAARGAGSEARSAAGGRREARPQPAGATSRPRTAGPPDEKAAASAESRRRPARKSSSASAQRAAKPRTARRDSTAIEPPVPPQGFEPEDELAASTPIEPPSALELAGSIAELAGEMAQAGLSASGRLLKGALSRISGG